MQDRSCNDRSEDTAYETTDISLRESVEPEGVGMAQIRSDVENGATAPCTGQDLDEAASGKAIEGSGDVTNGDGRRRDSIRMMPWPDSETAGPGIENDRHIIFISNLQNITAELSVKTDHIRHLHMGSIAQGREMEKEIIMLKDGKIVEIPAGKPARTPKQIFGTRRQRRMRAIRCAAIRMSVVVAAVLFMAALATPGEPGYQPQYASGLVVTVIVCGGWIAAVWYANSDIRRRAERKARRSAAIRRAGKAAGLDTDGQAVRKTEVQDPGRDEAGVQDHGAGRGCGRQGLGTAEDRVVPGSENVQAHLPHGQRMFFVGGAGISEHGSAQIAGQRI